MTITSFRDLDVYQRSIKIMVKIHKLALALPDYERFDLADQMRRASKSVPTNIAEGYGRRKSAKEFKRFLTLSLGSANEMMVHLEIARELGYATPEVCNNLIEEYNVVGKMLYRLIENWRTHSPVSLEKPTQKRASHI